MIACLYGPQRTHHVVSPPSPTTPLNTPLWTSSTTAAIVTTKPKRKPLPDGVELTLSELQEMASRQQQQIESHQQLLIAKEQRVKFLKQQEYRHQEIAAENERLRWLRDRVEAQEMKLHKLRALRGQVDQQKINNSSLTSELESIRSLFNAKEKELSVAVAKVEQLTMQLEELRRGRINGVGGGRQNFPAAIELEKLRQELLYRNKLNEQQNSKLVQQREVLNQRTEEMGRIDRRIAELQQRLHRKRLLNQQLASQINAATSAKQAQLRANQKKGRVSEPGNNGGTINNGGSGGGVRMGAVFGSNIAAVEPYQHLPNEGHGVVVQQDRVQDDLHTKLNSGTSATISEELSIFHPNKNDPKYQTLPYNTKFSTKYGAKNGGGSGSSGGEVSGGDSDESKNGQSSGTDGTNVMKRLEEKIPISSQVSPSVGGIPPNTGQNGRAAPPQQQQQQPKGLPLGVPSQTVHSIPTYAPAKAHATPVPQGSVPSTEIQPQQQQQQQPTISKASSQPITSYAMARHYGTAYPSGPSARAQLMENTTNAGNGTKMVAPPYIPPPASTMHKANNNSHHQSHPSMDMNQKPISAIQPSTVHHVKAPIQSISVSHSIPNRPATTYQSAATRFVPPTPHLAQGEGTESESTQVVVSSTSIQQGSNSSVDSNRSGQPLTGRGGDALEVSSSSDGGTGSSSDTSSSNIPKPALPPKPCIPQKPTPPPRQIHSMIEKSRAAAGLDTSPEAIDSALSVLHSSAQQAGSGHRYASKSVIANTYTRRVTNGVFDQYLKNVNQFYGKGEMDGCGGGGDDHEAHSEQDAQNRNQDSSMPPSSSSQKKTNPNELPIKPKPLTIKKQTGVEPPKLRGCGGHTSSTSSSSTGARKGSGDVSQSTRPTTAIQSNVATPNYHVSLNRRIEIPPAFLFPEGESPPSDLGGGGGGSLSSSSTNQMVSVTNNGPPAHPYNTYSNDVLDQCSSKYHGPNDGVLSVLPNTLVNQEDLITSPNGSNSNNMNTNRTVDKDKRRPLLDCGSVGSSDGGHLSLLDNNANTNNEGDHHHLIRDDGHCDEQNTNQIHSKLDDGCERQGPVGGTLEENNNLIDITIRDDNSPNNGISGFIDPVLNNDNGMLSPESNVVQTIVGESVSRRVKKTNLKSKNSTKTTRRVSFDPLALLLDAALEGELELVRKTAQEVPNPSAANDEGITALHNAICAGHYEIVKFLVEFGCDVNAQDSDGWTPLHCAASCNNLPMVKFLVEHGACIFATTLSDHETAAEKCEEDEEGFDGCTEYLYSIQEKLGILNNGVVYALYDYDAQSTDELCFKDRDVIVVLRKGDEFEREWWWSKVKDREGYIPRNLLGLYPRVEESANN